MIDLRLWRETEEAVLEILNRSSASEHYVHHLVQIRFGENYSQRITDLVITSLFEDGELRRHSWVERKTQLHSHWVYERNNVLDRIADALGDR